MYMFFLKTNKKEQQITLFQYVFSINHTLFQPENCLFCTLFQCKKDEIICLVEKLTVTLDKDLHLAEKK